MTNLEAINKALLALGVEPLVSESANTKAGRVMRSLLSEVKKTVLQDFPWPFATRRRALGSPLAVSAPGGFARVFGYPRGALCLRALRDMRGEHQEFCTFEGGVATNVVAGEMEYTAHVDNLDLWPWYVAECLIPRLASEGAMSLSGSMQVAMNMPEKYTMQVRMAAQIAVTEAMEKTFEARDYIDVRG